MNAAQRDSYIEKRARQRGKIQHHRVQRRKWSTLTLERTDGILEAIVGELFLQCLYQLLPHMVNL